VSKARVTSTGLLLLLLAGCAREVPPGIQEARARQAEADRQGRDIDIPRYHAAARASEVGQVTGRVYEERRKPDAADTPLAGTILMALPRSETWLAMLETIRAQSRDSLDRYRDAAPAVRRAREALERALLELGGGDLPQSVGVNADGTFTLPPLPSGEWVLLAAYMAPGKHAPVRRTDGGKHSPNDPQGRASASERFLPRSTLVGHDFVTLWLREITVRPGAAEAVMLTPRNAWLTAVVEDRETPVFRVSPAAISGAPSVGTNPTTPSR
jgi:hypothetical protein